MEELPEADPLVLATHQFQVSEDVRGLASAG
jgi:hypothetical protein